jgi:hypothetical protein
MGKGPAKPANTEAKDKTSESSWASALTVFPQRWWGVLILFVCFNVAVLIVIFTVRTAVERDCFYIAGHPWGPPCKATSNASGRLVMTRFDKDGRYDGKRPAKPFSSLTNVEKDVFVPGTETQDYCIVSGFHALSSPTASPLCLVEPRQASVGPGWKVTFGGATCEVLCFKHEGGQ